MRILLVEEERKVADLVARGLKAERYALHAAPDGDTGWATANPYDYDLVIFDLLFPGINGLDLVRRIRHQNAEAPILVLTARDATASKVEGFEASADDYLMKPFALADLQVRAKGESRNTDNL
jgi:DNA-binding response OmpR family regulator